MPAKLAEADQMTVEEFLAFYDARPDGEKWELIEGVAVMSPSPTEWHERIVANLTTALDLAKLAKNASWTGLPGVGTRVPVSRNSLPEPDVFVKAASLANVSVTEDALILFEILAKSNTKSDQAWRKRVYSSVPNCQHYVTIATDVAEVTRYDRTEGWRATTFSGLDESLSLAAIDVSIPLRTIYRWTEIT